MSRTTIAMTDTLNDYLLSICGEIPEVNRRLREETAVLAQGRMQISLEQGRLMGLLVQATGARRIIEVGTFTGYSALVMAQALPADGKIIACDVSEEWTAIGKRYWHEAGVAGKIDLRIAPAIETLEALIADGQSGTFDFVFIDADKSNYQKYYEAALKLLRVGGMIGVDNTLWGGRVADKEVTDEDTVAIRELNAKMHSDPRVFVSVIPIGDGFSLALKR